MTSQPPSKNELETKGSPALASSALYPKHDRLSNDNRSKDGSSQPSLDTTQKERLMHSDMFQAGSDVSKGDASKEDDSKQGGSEEEHPAQEMGHAKGTNNETGHSNSERYPSWYAM